MPAAPDQAAHDRGSSVAEFAMVIVLLMFLFLGLVSIGLWLHVRTVLTAAAADTARYVANADIAPDDAAARARELMTGTAAESTSDSLRCSNTVDDVFVGVTCTLAAPGIVGLLDGVLPDITVTGHAAREAP